MNAKKTKNFRTRLISVFLVIMVLFTYLPYTTFTSAIGYRGPNNPIVLTNANVEFRDSSFRSINEVDSGALFYLMITIAGNNVQQTDIKDIYRVYITDDNLLLPNFAGNGFTNGAVYNGHTLYVEKDADGNVTNRYVEFNIANGETKVIRLQAKFANGKTPDDDEAVVKLVQESSGKSVSNTIKANSQMEWSASKSEDRTQLSSSEITTGTTVNYTLNASPNNPTKSTGVEWVETLHFSDQITLSNITFADGAQKSIEDAIILAVSNAGYTIKQDTLKINAPEGSATATIDFDIESKNTNTEMEAVRLNVAMPFNSSTIQLGTSDATVENKLDVTGKPYNSDTFKLIGGNTVSLNVTPPAGPQFTLSKYVNDKQTFYMGGNTVEFTISATNYGDQAGPITLTDKIPNGLTFSEIISGDATESGGTVTLSSDSVKPGETISAVIKCEVNEINGEDQTITNAVTDGKKTASDSILVKEEKTDFEITKTGYVEFNGNQVTNESGDPAYVQQLDNQTAHYTITLTNTGTTDLDKAKITDVLPDGITFDSNSIGYSNETYVNDGPSANGNGYVWTVSIPAGESLSIWITGSINTNASGTLTNTVSADYNNITKTDEAEFIQTNGKAQIDVEKSVNKDTYVDGDNLTYTITIKNNGTSRAANFQLTDKRPDGFHFSFMQISSNLPNSSIIFPNIQELQPDENVYLDFSNGYIRPGEIVTIILKGTVENGYTDTIENSVEYSFRDGAQFTSTTSNTVYTRKDTSGDYKLEKWAVDGESTEYIQGEFITYRIKFTNLADADGIKDLYLFDHATELNFTKDGQYNTDIISLEVVSEGNEKYPKGTIISNVGSGAGGMAGFFCNLPDINLSIGESIELEYKACFYGNASGGSRDNETGYMINPTELKPELNQKGIYNYVKCSKDDGATFIAEDLTWNAVRNSFSTTKDVSPSSVDISNKSVDDLLNEEFEYAITFTPNTQDETNYQGKTFTITDVLPEGMTYVADSIGGTYDYGIQITQISTNLSTNEEGKTILTIEFVCPTSLMGYSQPISITYKTKLTEEKAQKLYETKDKNTKLTNTVTEIAITDLKSKTPNASATVSFKKVNPAPGFAKIAYQSFPGTSYDKDLLQPVNNGYITAGDTLIWRTVVYNGDGSDNYTSDNTADLINYSVTDTLPGSYDFDDGTTGYPKSIKIYTIGNDGLPDKQVQDIQWVEPKVNGKNHTWVFEGDTYKLSPNQCLVIEFATVAATAKEGVITNTGFATIDQNFSVQDTVAGEKQDTNIWNYANYNIVGLTTESWKTITYENQGHTGDPHTDPITDTGESRTPTHNYVQGMQGEDVTYTLNVTNHSPLPLENFTIIDRLPYVNDIGLVSGYDRNSAFGIMMNKISSVSVGGTTLTEGIDYIISYSNDKNSTLTENSKDWRGQNDVMSWTNALTSDTVNFRIQFLNHKDMNDDPTIINPEETVVVTFTGTVPSYVANTGEENIAWNSFAYSYQNTMVLGDTVMVAEPAKVGVWVETPDTSIDININKTISAAETTNTTFYFALFADKNYSKRLSDIVSVMIPAGQTNASVTMKDVDMVSIKKLLENAGVTQADNVYLLETDAKGNKIKAYTPEYTDNEISLTTSENVTVGVTNTKNTGTITVNKTLSGTNITGDTFYFALFTKNGESFIRYEEVPVQSLTFTEEGEKSLTFENVPLETEFYVLETNANGVVADDDFGTYTSDSGINYTSLPIDGAKASANGTACSITNTEVTDYKITVTKELISNEIKTNPKFTVGLFTETNGVYTLQEKKEITSGNEITFSGLNKDTVYYVFELDENDNRIAAGEKLIKSEVYFDSKTKETDVPFIVVYDGGGTMPIQFTGTNAQGELTETTHNNVIITNNHTDEVQNKIIVTKRAYNAGIAEEGHTISVGLYTLKSSDADLTNPESYNLIDKKEDVSTGSDGTFTVTFDKLTVAKTDESGKTEPIYYVFELDSSGNIVFDGTTTKVKVAGLENTYLAEYPNGNVVVLEAGISGEVIITDIASNEIELSFSKLDVTGTPYTGAIMTITADNSISDLSNCTISSNTSESDKTNGQINGNQIIWTSADNALKVKGLPAGKYTLKETPISGFEIISIPFEIDDDGYLKIVDDNGELITGNNLAISANKLTVFNRSILNVCKQDITDKEGKELAGAQIQITLNDSDKNLQEELLTLSRPETVFTKVDQFGETTDYTKYTLDSKSLTFYSDGKNPTKITGLPDGSYTMTEITAPDDYAKAESLDFIIKNGIVSALGENPAYEVTDALTSDDNIIIMKDSKEKFVSISKLDATKENSMEIAGAELRIISDTELDAGKIKLIRTDAEGNNITLTLNEDYTIVNKTITFTSADIPTQINGLPSGTYILKETGAPDGYLLYEDTATFTIDDDGNVTGTTSIADQPSKISITKKDITGKIEITGAVLKLTYNGRAEESTEEASDLSKAVVSFEADKRDDTTIEWTSQTGKAMEITYLPDGVYTLEEFDANNNGEFEYDGKTYSVLGTKMTFTVEDGVIKSDSVSGAQNSYKNSDADDADTGYYYYSEDDANSIEICDAEAPAKSVSVDISKQDTALKEIPGATLRVYYTDTVAVTDANGNEVIDADGNVQTTVIEVNVAEWESDIESAKTINGLTPDKEYILEEIGAPNGYAYSKNITFSVNKDGKVTVDENGNTDEYGKVIIMTDKALDLSINKMDINKTNEVIGAKLQLFDKDNNIIDEWTSGKEVHKIDVNKLKAGETYTLHEENAPDGYAYAEDIAFTIQDDGTIKLASDNNGELDGSTVIMKDDITKVSISKKDAATGNEIGDAELELYQITDKDGTEITEKLVDSWTSEEGKTHDINGTLIAGAAYRLVEKTAPNGYQTAEAVEFIVNTDGTVNKVEMLDAPEGQVVISKQSVNNTDELPGATLQILKGDEIIEEWISGTEAKAFQLDAGTYTLKEITAPDGYIVAESIKFNVDKNGKVTLENGIETGTIIMKDDITKVSISKKDATTGNEIGDAELELYQITDKEGTEITEKLVDSWTSEEGKTHDINGTLIAGAAYRLVEKTAPNGYQTAEAVEFTVNTDGTVNKVEMLDAPEGQVVISKQSVNNTDELPGATLQILKGDEIIEEWISGTEAKAFQLDAGTYTLKEITAPDGYIVAESIKFNVDKNGKVTLENGIETGTIIMKDDYTKVKISKQDITSGEELVGAKLQILDHNGAVIEEWISSTQAHDIYQLTPGEYTLHEESAPDGYAYASDIIFTIEETGNVQTVTMKDQALKVSLSKKTLTGEDELAGAELTLYQLITDEDGKETRVLVDNWTSGTAAHEITLNTDTTGNTSLVAGGTYIMVETRAPMGYQIAEEIIFTINKDGSITDSTTMRDAEIGQLGISKLDVAGEEVVGATLQILDNNGTTVEEWISTNEAHIVQLDAGTYTLKEITAPNGYLVAESITFIVDDKGNATVNGKNVNGQIIMTDEIAQISISKVGKDGSAEAELAGAGMKLTYNGDGSLDNVTASNGTITKNGKIITWTSGNTAITLNKIPNGSYVLEETLVPNGYDAATEITFEVKDGKVINVKIENDSKSTYKDGIIRMFDAITAVTTSPATTTETTTTNSTTETTVATTVSINPVTTVSKANTTTVSTTPVTTVSKANTTIVSTTPVTTVSKANTTIVSTTSVTTVSKANTTIVSTTPVTTVSKANTTIVSTTPVTTVSKANTNTGNITKTTTKITTSDITITSTIKAPATTLITDAITTTATEVPTETTTTTTTTVTEEEPATEEIMTTEETITVSYGVVIRKCDFAGNEIADASLTVEDLYGNLIDSWISVAGESHVIVNVETGVPYCLTETAAPIDFAIAESIYFQLEEDGTVSILTYMFDEEGNFILDESGAPILAAISQGTDNVITMIDEYIGTGNVTATETTTTTVSQNYDSGSSSDSSSNSNKKVASPKTYDHTLSVIMIPASVALATAIITGYKRKKK